MCGRLRTGLMDGLHVPPWDSSGSSFHEYPSASDITAAHGAKRPAKSEKNIRMEQEMLQTMINSIVRLSAPAGSPAGMYSGLTALLTYPGPPTHCACSSRICSMHENSKATAGGKASETASLARPNTKKRKKRPGKEPGRVSHGSTQDGGALASEQTVLESTNETSRPADSQQKPKLGKRKGIEQSAPQARQEHPSTRSEAQAACQQLTQVSKRAPARGARHGRPKGTGPWPGTRTRPRGYDAGRAQLANGSSCRRILRPHPQQSHGWRRQGERSSQPDAQQRLRKQSSPGLLHLQHRPRSRRGGSAAGTSSSRTLQLTNQGCPRM